jgi:acetyltransferase
MERTQIYTALKGVRGRASVDLAALERLLVRFGQLIAEQRWIKELDINPLIAGPDALLALDARVVVFGSDTSESQLPKLAIRPYPAQYVSNWTAKDGRQLIIRPILPEDEPLLAKFHGMLSDRTVFMRYMQPMMLSDRVIHERLARICHCDYDRDIVLVAEDPQGPDGRSILAVSRLSKLHGLDDEARFSMLVADSFQGKGIGEQLVSRALDVARGEHLRRVTATLTADNAPMRHVFEKLGFTLETTPDNKLQIASQEL